MIAFDCPHCGEALEVGDHLAGRVLACGACQRHVTAPYPMAEPARARQHRRARQSALGCWMAALGLLAALLFAAVVVLIRMRHSLYGE